MSLLSSKYIVFKDGCVSSVSSYPVVATDGSSVYEVPEKYQSLSYEEAILKLRVGPNGVVARKEVPPVENMKVALVGNWKMKCGIATYSEALWPEITKRVGDFRLFVEENDAPTGPLNELGNETIDPSKVITCWKRGKPLAGLIKALKEYDPDVIHIQHEFGIWPNAAYWLSLMSQLDDYNVFVTMHSVFHHKDKTIVEAAMPNIVVHLDGARDVLKNEKEVPGTVTVIPHGCHPTLHTEKLWNFYKSDHTIVQWGFGFSYKGYDDAIKTTAVLKQSYPDVFFTGLFSESQFNASGHQWYYNSLMHLVEELGLQDNVAIIRGFQSDASLDAYLRTNRVALFPYKSHPEHEVFGVSGAARYAMTKMLPIVTTNVNHFSDIPTLKGSTPEELASQIDSVFANSVVYNEQVKKQAEYAAENTWEKAADEHVKLFLTTK